MKSIITAFIPALILIVGLSSFNVGSNTAYLTGESKSGRTKISIDIQDIDGILEQASLQIDGTGRLYNSEDANVVFAPQNGVFTLSIEEANGDWLKLWAIPSTFRTISEGNSQLYKFKANIEGTDPRKDKDITPIITLNCQLKYDI